MVTLGFGFKSYLSYKIRLKKQKEIQKVNEFYMQLTAKALPLELQLKDKEKFKSKFLLNFLILSENLLRSVLLKIKFKI